jgi:hypothetical protein
MNALPDKNIKCPATGFSKTCREIVADCECPKFVQLRGTDPNSGEPVDKFGCVDSFIPMLLIENSQQQRQTGAAVESFRNEMVKANAQTLQILTISTGVQAVPAMIGPHGETGFTYQLPKR